MEQQSIADKMAKMKARLKSDSGSEEKPAAAAPAAPQSSDERAAAMKAKLSKGNAEAPKPALSVVDGGSEKEEKPAPKKAPKKAAAPKKSVNPPEAPQVTPTTLSPLQGRAWDLATVLLKEQVATGQKPNAKVIAEQLQALAEVIKGL